MSQSDIKRMLQKRVDSMGGLSLGGYNLGSIKKELNQRIKNLQDYKKNMNLKSFIQRSGPEGTTESKCYTCAHCNIIVEIKSKEQPMGFCHMCFYPTCIKCGALTKCDPFEKKIERLELRSRMLANI